jgi:predicted outer membrane protein
MKKSIWMAIIALSSTFFFVACDNDDDPEPTPTLDQYDVNFLNRATRANRATIALNQLAADSFTNPGVQQYAQDMLASSQSAQKTLDSIASIYSLQLPTTGDTAVAVFRDSLMVMGRGRDFDTSFVGYQMRLLDYYLLDVNDAVTNAKNQGVKDYASGRSPIMTNFRDRAQTLFGTL